MVSKPEALVYDVPFAGRLLGLSRATAYAMVNQGVIPSIRFGRRVVVPIAALNRMLSEAGTKPGDNHS